MNFTYGSSRFMLVVVCAIKTYIGGHIYLATVIVILKERKKETLLSIIIGITT